MMKKVVIGVCAGLVFLFCLVLTMPARFALQFVQFPPGVQLGGVEGSVWRGQIDAVRAEDVFLRELQWRVRPASLLSGRLGVDIEITDHVDNMLIGQGHLVASSDQLIVRGLELEARVTDLASYAPEPSPFPLRGDVVLRLDEFQLGQPICTQAAGQVELVGGGIQVGQNWESLGALVATIGCDQGWLTAELEPNTLGLSASMRASLQNANGEFQISESADAPRTVRNLVSMLPEQARRPQPFSVDF